MAEKLKLTRGGEVLVGRWEDQIGTWDKNEDGSGYWAEITLHRIPISIEGAKVKDIRESIQEKLALLEDKDVLEAVESLTESIRLACAPRCPECGAVSPRRAPNGDSICGGMEDDCDVCWFRDGVVTARLDADEDEDDEDDEYGGHDPDDCCERCKDYHPDGDLYECCRCGDVFCEGCCTMDGPEEAPICEICQMEYEQELEDEKYTDEDDEE